MSYLSDTVIAHLRTVSDEPDLSGTRYRLLDGLGRGGMATVYAARDIELEREVAVKVLDATDPDGALAERMLREARILARLEHPGIVPIHDVGHLPDQRVFYVMKRVRGRRLDAFIAAMPDRDAGLRVFERICEAVAFAHASGVLHRDLKPENVMVGEYGEVLVMDWGVGKIVGRDRDRDRRRVGDGVGGGEGIGEGEGEGIGEGEGGVTLHGMRIGTPGFMAPEQAAGDVASVGVGADVWGLGAILHVIACAEPPEAAHLRAALPRRLRAILDRALAPSSEDRYPDADELAEDVRRFRTGGNPVAYQEPLHERIGRAAWKYRVPIALVASYVVMRVVLLLS